MCVWFFLVPGGGKKKKTISNIYWMFPAPQVQFHVLLHINSFRTKQPYEEGIIILFLQKKKWSREVVHLLQVTKKVSWETNIVSQVVWLQSLCN